jgi:hypothetical protein
MDSAERSVFLERNSHCRTGLDAHEDAVCLVDVSAARYHDTPSNTCKRCDRRLGVLLTHRDHMENDVRRYRSDLIWNSPHRHCRVWMREFRDTRWKRTRMLPPMKHCHLVPLRRQESHYAAAYGAGSTDYKNAHSTRIGARPGIPTWRVLECLADG